VRLELTIDVGQKVSETDMKNSRARLDEWGVEKARRRAAH
jgi:hypothetical protein